MKWLSRNVLGLLSSVVKSLMKTKMPKIPGPCRSLVKTDSRSQSLPHMALFRKQRVRKSVQRSPQNCAEAVQHLGKPHLRAGSPTSDSKAGA